MMTPLDQLGFSFVTLGIAIFLLTAYIEVGYNCNKKLSIAGAFMFGLCAAWFVGGIAIIISDHVRWVS